MTKKKPRKGYREYPGIVKLLKQRKLCKKDIEALPESLLEALSLFGLVTPEPLDGSKKHMVLRVCQPVWFYRQEFACVVSAKALSLRFARLKELRLTRSNSWYGPHLNTLAERKLDAQRDLNSQHAKKLAHATKAKHAKFSGDREGIEIEVCTIYCKTPEQALDFYNDLAAIKRKLRIK